MTWTCDQIEARLGDYLEGALQGPERADFEAHVESCAECAPLLASVKSLVSELRSMEAVETPAGFVERILDQTVGPRKTESAWEALRNFVSGLATPKFAYGVASVIATMFIVMSTLGVSLRKPKLADLQPATVVRNMDRQAHLVYARGVKYVSDLRVVYEIQSRLRQDQNELQVTPEETVPKSAPDTEPGQKNDHTGTQPKQQNRANEVGRQMELLAAQCPFVLERSFR
jgi:anti-sigma factor RsiW